MRIPIARDGLGVLLACTLGLVVLGAVGSLVTPWIWAAVAIVWLWTVAFFRDPDRKTPARGNVLYAPADGRVTEVAELPNHERVAGPCVRIRIFLSLFNVHINRMPCAASVSEVEQRPGRYINALSPRAADVNESNAVVLAPASPFRGPLIVRQITGVVARTIVCHARVGDRFEAGQRFGMIKFGSGTELVVPKQVGLRTVVHTGARVKAGLSPLIEIDTMEMENDDDQAGVTHGGHRQTS